MNNKWITILIIIVLVSAGGSALYFVDRSPAVDENIGIEPSGTEISIVDERGRNELLLSNILSGGVPKDGIPPIDKPQYISMKEAEELLRQNDRVFVVESAEGVKIFPQNILVWHEIVNDVIDGQNVSITYCPLTGSAIGYNCHLSETPTTLGVSGKLLNSNLVMYDRESDTYWPQILGEGINNKFADRVLETFPVYWTTWEKASQKYDNALVLSRTTGYIRDYEKDPYGDYKNPSSRSYYSSEGLMFPIMNVNNELNNKKVVVGIKGDDGVAALDPLYVRKKKVVNLVVGFDPVVAIYDETLDAVRVYKRVLNGEMIEFNMVNNKLVDNMHNYEWNVNGQVVSEPNIGQRLETLTSFDVMWFAWYAFYPETELIMGD